MKCTISLRENCDFKRLYYSKRSAVSPYFVFYCRKNNLKVNRLGLTVSVKLGCAVRRNRIKRRLKEVYRLCESRLLTSNDMVLVARSRVEYAKFAALQRDFLNCAEKLSILKPV